MPIKTIPLHANGHRITGSEDRDTVKVFTGSPLPFVADALFDCRNCGLQPRPKITDDGAYIRTPCQYTEGITTTIRLNVPSGKIIVSTDLRPIYDGFSNTFVSYGSTLGVSQVIYAYAEQGCAFGFVGTLWPDLFRTGPDTYVLANPEYSDDDEPMVPSNWERLAGVSGAVWAYCIADYGDFTKRGGDPMKLECCEIVDIPAGTYEFTYHGGEKGFDMDSLGTLVFTDIRKLS
jgi:hypothetical protein